LIGLLSLLLLLTTPANQRTTVLWFGGLTLAVGGSLRLIRGGSLPPAKPQLDQNGLPIVLRTESGS